VPKALYRLDGPAHAVLWRLWFPRVVRSRRAETRCAAAFATGLSSRIPALPPFFSFRSWR
jgi:hypothetical protein